MSIPYYVNSDGTLPMQDGQPVLISEFAFRECCCGTGCQCYWIYEWDCETDGWVLVNSGVASEENLNGYQGGIAADTWVIQYYKRSIPRSATIIRARYVSWIDCEGSCSDPGAPPSPLASWVAWKCDGSEPTDPGESDGKCQKLAYYEYDCEIDEWGLIRVDVIRSRLPQGTEIPSPNEPWNVLVFGEVYDCSDGDDETPTPPEPKKSNPDDFCASCGPDVLGSYRVVFDVTKTYGGTTYRFFGDEVIPDVDVCHWQANRTVGYQPNGGSVTTAFVRLNLFISGPFWEFNVGFTTTGTTARSKRQYGLTPVGDYEPFDDTTGTAEVS